MSGDYFDHVERSLREAVRERRHLPWHRRLLSRPSRAALVATVVLLGGGSALAATGVLRTGASVSDEVRPTPAAREGTVIASSVRLLPIRVRDPDGGPPWGLRAARTSRGLLCLEVGRVVDGRLGVLGRDGAFDDDRAFHPFSTDYLPNVGCATDDRRGNAFINAQLHGIPASGLLEGARYTSGGCYGASPRPPACPLAELRDVYFGMLGPDADAITESTARGGKTVLATVAPSGAYLVVLAHREQHCVPGMLVCSIGNGYTSSPTLPVNEAITAVSYANRPPCRLPSPQELLQQHLEHEKRLREALRRRYPAIYARLRFRAGLSPTGLASLSPRQLAELQALRTPLREPACPDVGFLAPRRPGGSLTAAQLASPVSAHLQRAARYCERGETIVACDDAVPPGYKRLPMKGPPRALLVVDFTAREAVTNFDSHYEIETTSPQDPRHPGFQEGCGGTFGPTQSNLRAGQRVRHTMFLNPGCHGVTHITVSYVTVDGPSGSMPVPGLPGQSTPIPVGETTVELP